MKATKGSKLSVKKAFKKGELHPNNPHRGRYDLVALCKSSPELKAFIKPNPKGDNTIDFSDENAVLCLNRALLAHYYHVSNWQIPEGYLCPPIPGRADYIHYVADLLALCSSPEPEPESANLAKKIKVLDVGTGANCIYPIIGSQCYGWAFTATDIDPVSVNSAKAIVKSNTCLQGKVDVVLQKDAKSIFKGIIQPHDHFLLTICNPPFHSSMAEAKAGSQRKWKNLNKAGAPSAKKNAEPKLNFGGQKAELWCQGGEITFLTRMAKESVAFGHQVAWFTSLVSKKENVRPLQTLLAQLGASQVKVIDMSQGQKVSRLVAWRF